MTGINCSDCIRLARFYLILKSHNETIMNYKINVTNQKITRRCKYYCYNIQAQKWPLTNEKYNLFYTWSKL